MLIIYLYEKNALLQLTIMSAGFSFLSFLCSPRMENTTHKREQAVHMRGNTQANEVARLPISEQKTAYWLEKYDLFCAVQLY